MAIQKLTVRIPSAGAIRLDQCSAPSVSRAFLRKLIVAGAVYVNGKRCKVSSRMLRGGETVDIYVNSDLKKEERRAEDFLPLRILYEDEAVICFDKPAGLPTQPTVDNARVNLYELAKKQLTGQTGASGNKPVYLGLHHRLDRDTSGVVLFTRAPEHNAFIADQFKNHDCRKTYVAVVAGKLKRSADRIESFLDETGRQGKIRRHGSVKSGGKKAITEYSVLKSNTRFSLVEVKILTGRTHQIRVHMSELGHPIVGDLLYGSAPELHRRTGRHLLHAHALEITHPVTRNRILIESPVPLEFRKWVDENPS